MKIQAKQQADPLPQSAADGSTRRKVLGLIAPQYWLLLVFGLLLVVLRLTFSRPLSLDVYSVRYALWMVLAFTLAGLGREAVAARRQGRPLSVGGPVRMVRDWFPFVLCLWVYENLHDLTLWIRPDTVDATLARADLLLFGVQPSVWLERFAHPLLTDYMALAYLTYFFFPTLLAGWLYLRGEVAAFKELQLGMLCCFYLGFVGYILVPAVGPHLILDYAAPLKGRYLFWDAKQLVATLQTFPRDCFPSLHTAISTVTLLFFYRHRRAIPALRWVAPPVTVLTVSLWVSTVYLRYHWAVDVFAGLALAGLAYRLGVWLQRVDAARAPRPAKLV